jgi:hypothetical protein
VARQAMIKMVSDSRSNIKKQQTERAARAVS